MTVGRVYGICGKGAILKKVLLPHLFLETADLRGKRRCIVQNAEEKSNIYSVGATFYHLMTGKKIKNHREIPDAGLLAERTSEAFAKVLLKALEIDPADRYQSAYEMFRAFQGVTKKDARYQTLLKRQRAAGIIASLAGLLAAGKVFAKQRERLLEKIETE